MLAALGIFFLCLVAIPLGMIWNAFVVTKLWAWFIVPIFGLAPLALVPAMGVVLVIAYLTHQTPTKSKSGDDITEGFIHALCVVVLKPAIALVVGWIILQFM
jgi:hypothetical protein